MTKRLLSFLCAVTLLLFLACPALADAPGRLVLPNYYAVYEEQEDAYYIKLTDASIPLLTYSAIYRVDSRTGAADEVERIYYNRISSILVSGDTLVYDLEMNTRNKDLHPYALDLITGQRKRLTDGVLLGFRDHTVYYGYRSAVYGYDLLTGEAQFLFECVRVYGCETGFYFQPNAESLTYDFWDIETGEKTATAIECARKTEFSGDYYLDKETGVLYTAAGEEALDLQLAEGGKCGLTERYVYRESDGVLTLWRLTDLAQVREIALDETVAWFLIFGNKAFLYQHQDRVYCMVEIPTGEAVDVTLR